MKKALLAAGLLAAGPGARAQVLLPPYDSSLHANQIRIRTPGSALAAYHQLGQTLITAGYDLERASYDAGRTSPQLAYITTIARELPTRHPVLVTLQTAVVPDSTGVAIELRGTYRTRRKNLPLTNQGQSGSAAQAAWQELRRVALLFPAGVVTYRQAP